MDLMVLGRHENNKFAFLASACNLDSVPVFEKIECVTKYEVNL